ncbi:MAG: sugar O-acetyltransferase [Erysipelotrichaceae bacterium]|nr:sugar O-acetyltransferase [Erysipelotrichaceae bacterium]
MTEREKALAGYLFRQGDPDLARERNRAHELCFRYNQTNPTDTETQQKILKELIGSIKGTITINAPFYCDYGSRIAVGDNFFANYNCKILDGAMVTFGDDVRIGPDCSFLTPNHSPDPQMRREGYEIFQPVTVGDNVWFGASVTVLPGVTIGKDSIIAAGSVVSRDIPEGVLAAGVPCKVIRKLNEEDRNRYPRIED